MAVQKQSFLMIGHHLRPSLPDIGHQIPDCLVVDRDYPLLGAFAETAYETIINVDVVDVQ
ncbi:MAG: hypothetical protein DDT26_01461 [Dehalococcoidia bacterium]|nr:hypothetical protein [Chloroflexota bacterium]